MASYYYSPIFDDKLKKIIGLFYGISLVATIALVLCRYYVAPSQYITVLAVLSSSSFLSLLSTLCVHALNQDWLMPYAEETMIQILVAWYMAATLLSLIDYCWGWQLSLEWWIILIILAIDSAISMLLAIQAFLLPEDKD